MQRIIIGIHGLGPKPAKELYYRWWRKSLYEGFSRIGHPRRRVPFITCYWADILHAVPQLPSITDRDDKRFLDEPYVHGSVMPIPKPSLMRKTLMGLFAKQMDRLKLDPDGSIIWKHISDLVIQKYFFDLDCYFSNCLKPAEDGPQPVADRIRGRLRQLLLQHQDKEILLIAHSMGSIIAYDVLAHSQPGLRVHTLITIGAPLGVPVVVHKIRKDWNMTAGLPPAPDAVTHNWYNLADLEDKVAFDYILSDDYTANRHQVAPVDVQVANDYVYNNRRNPHKDFGYLRTPELARICFEFISHGLSETQIRHQDQLYRIYEMVTGLPHLFRRKHK